MLRALICEGPGGYALRLKRMLEHDGDIGVVAVCASAGEAVAALPRVRPDVVMMGLDPSGTDWLAAIEEIMSGQPLPILVLSADADYGGGQAAAALAAGALDVMGWKGIGLRDPGSAAAAMFRHRVKVLSRAPVIRHPRAGLRNKLGDNPGAPAPGRTASVIGVCGSAGGPYVLAQLLGDLSADYEIPILVVQHIAAGFTEGFADWLDRTAPLPVRIAEDGAAATAGAWIAPEGAHLRLTSTGRLHLDRATAGGHHRPSGDVLFESIATAAGETGVVVVLSGMGSDGASGAAAVHRSGGLVIAQDEESSPIYGMPREAVARGADLVLSPGEIAACLTGLRHQQITGTWRCRSAR